MRSGTRMRGIHKAVLKAALLSALFAGCANVVGVDDFSVAEDASDASDVASSSSSDASAVAASAGASGGGCAGGCPNGYACSASSDMCRPRTRSPRCTCRRSRSRPRPRTPLRGAMRGVLRRRGVRRGHAMRGRELQGLLLLPVRERNAPHGYGAAVVEGRVPDPRGQRLRWVGGLVEGARRVNFEMIFSGGACGRSGQACCDGNMCGIGGCTQFNPPPSSEPAYSVVSGTQCK